MVVPLVCSTRARSPGTVGAAVGGTGTVLPRSVKSPATCRSGTRVSTGTPGEGEGEG